MAAIGSVLFAVLVWGAIVLVFAVFAYEMYVIMRDVGAVAERIPSRDKE